MCVCVCCLFLINCPLIRQMNGGQEKLIRRPDPGVAMATLIPAVLFLLRWDNSLMSSVLFGRF